MAKLLMPIWMVGNIGTFVFLTFFDGYDYSWWNWIIAIAVNEFLAMIWPVYWGLLHWVM